MILFIIFRALLLDRAWPWFETPPSELAPVPKAVPAEPARRLGRPLRSRGIPR